MTIFGIKISPGSSFSKWWWWWWLGWLHSSTAEAPLICLLWDANGRFKAHSSYFADLSTYASYACSDDNGRFEAQSNHFGWAWSLDLHRECPCVFCLLWPCGCATRMPLRMFSSICCIWTGKCCATDRYHPKVLKIWRALNGVYELEKHSLSSHQRIILEIYSMWKLLQAFVDRYRQIWSHINSRVQCA